MVRIPCNKGDVGSIPGSGISPGGGQGNPLQYWQENLMDRVTWQAVVHRVTKSWTQMKRLSRQACKEPSRVKKLSEIWSLNPGFKWGLGYINKQKIMLVTRTRIKPQRRKTISQLQKGATCPWMKLLLYLSFVEIIFVLKCYVGLYFQGWRSNICGKIEKS